MSYILDALKRANSERERGSVPTLHANPGPADLAGDEADRSPARRMPLALWLGAGAVLLLAAAYLLWPAKEKQPAPVLVQTPLPAPAPAPTAAATVHLDVPPPQQQAPVIPEPKPVATPAPARIPTLAELPDNIRRQIPALTSGGAMYSDTPASRMLILNGQLLREGEKLAPDLVLEEIRLKGAVLNYQGQRFTIAY